MGLVGVPVTCGRRGVTIDCFELGFGLVDDGRFVVMAEEGVVLILEEELEVGWLNEEGGGRALLVDDGVLPRFLAERFDPAAVVVDAGLAVPGPEAELIVDFGLCAVGVEETVEVGFRTEEVDEEGLLTVPPLPVLDAIVVEVPFAAGFVLEALLVLVDAVADAGVGSFDEKVDFTGGAVGRVPEETLRMVEVAVADLGSVEGGIRLADVEELGPF